MINSYSYELYDKMYENSDTDYLLDLYIIDLVRTNLDFILDLSDADNKKYQRIFKELASEVKRQYLKYEDTALNDDLVQTIYYELGGEENE